MKLRNVTNKTLFNCTITKVKPKIIFSIHNSVNRIKSKKMLTSSPPEDDSKTFPCPHKVRNLCITIKRIGWSFQTSLKCD